MPFLIRIYAITILCLGFGDIIAQSLNYFHLNSDKRLPSNTVWDIFQDSKGYIWYGTSNGITRYDSYNFKSWSNFSTQGINATDITEDKVGRIWFRNFRNELFYLENDTIVSYSKQNDLDIDQIIFSPNQFLLHKFGQPYSHIVDASSKKIRLGSLSSDREFVYHKAPLDSSGQLCLMRIKRDNYYFSHLENRKLLLKDDDSLQLDKHFIVRGSIGEFIYFRRNSQQYKSNYLISSVNKQIYKLNFSLLGDIHSLIHLKNNTYVLGTTRGLFIWNKKNNSLQKDPFFNGKIINKLFVDKENILHVATVNSGVFLINNLAIKSFTHYVNNQVANCTKLVHFANKIIFSVNNNSLGYLSNNTIKLFDYRFPLVIQIMYSDQKQLLACDNSTLIKLPQNLNIRSFLDKENTPLNLKSFAKNSKDVLYTGNHVSLYKMDLKELNPRFQNIHFFKNATRTYYFYNDTKKDQILWSTQKGIYTINKNSIRPLLIDEKHFTFKVTGIVQSEEGKYWFMTPNNGVFVVQNNQIIRHIYKAYKLDQRSCRQIIKHKGFIWLATDKGLFKINSSNYTYNKIDVFDGIISNNINSVLALKDSIYIGTPKGISVFHPKDIRHNKTPPPIYIEKVTFFDRDTTLSKQYTVSYLNNNIKITFNGLSYKSQQQFSYQYRLRGFNNEWITIPSDLNYAYFPKLLPGKYLFEVYCINEDGTKSIQPATIQFIINTPFWKKSWFILTVIGLLVGIISLVNYWIYLQQLKKEKIQQRINNLKMQALQAQMNPHFVFNALNSIQRFLLDTDEVKAVSYLSKFAKLIRIIFEQSKKTTIPLYKEIEFLELYLSLENLRFKDKIDIWFDIDDRVRNSSKEIPPLLIQPIIENAFKHGLLHKEENGYLEISMNIENDYLFCTITDNGIGREASSKLNQWKKHNSSGLNITQQRIDLLQQQFKGKVTKISIEDLKNIDNHSLGTKVIIQIPLRSSYDEN